jgi:hypothetical protein
VDTPSRHVSDFVKAVCRWVFPLRDVWGTRHNLNCFLSALDKYILLDRIETFDLAHVVHGIRISDIPWLKGSTELSLGKSGGKKKKKKTGKQQSREDPVVDDGSAMDARRRHAYGTLQNLHRFMFWLYSEFINPLLSSCFYATEAEGCGSKVLFYRKPVWSEIVRRGQKQLQQNFIQVRPLCMHSCMHVLCVRCCMSPSTYDHTELVSYLCMYLSIYLLS